MQRQSLRTIGLILVLCSTPFLLGDVCGNGGGSDDGDEPGSGAGSVQFRVKYSSTYDAHITIRVTFAGEMDGSVPPGEGVGTPFTETKTFEGKPDLNTQEIIFSHRIVNLRPGTWRFSAEIPLTGWGPPWTAECVQTVPEGGSLSVGFTYGKAGCKTSGLFP